MNKADLEKLKTEVERSAKELLGEKLLKVVLYGSYSRGDFDAESDIDFALLSKITEIEISGYNDKIGEITSRLSIEYGVLVSMLIISKESFDEYGNALPFYKNLIKEGKVLYG